MLLKSKGQYVQAINYPTVPKGHEKLRIAVTPHHTIEMMNRFVGDLVEVWEELGIPFCKTPSQEKAELEQQAVKNAQPFCHKCSGSFRRHGLWNENMAFFCDIANCPVRMVPAYS